MENKFLEDLTEQEALQALVRRAVITYECRQLDEFAHGIFVLGTDTNEEIHLTAEAFDKFAEVLGKEPVIDEKWGEGSEFTKGRIYCSFTQDIMGNRFTVFCLKNKEVKE